MGWIAAGGASLLAASFIYTVCIRKASDVRQSQNLSPIHDSRASDASQEEKFRHAREHEADHGKRIHQDQDMPEIEISHSVTPPRHDEELTGKGQSQPQFEDPRSWSPHRTASPARTSSPPRLKSPKFSSMPAPPRPNNQTPVRPPPSAASSLRVPLTKVLPNTSMAPSSLMPPPKKPSRQVVLKPGHSPLDWAMLTSKPNHQLRGKDLPSSLIKVPPSQLKYYNGRKGRDSWTVYQGKVYNITPYLPFHPGGESELMRGAGKDSGKLFMEVHPWVNWDGMLGECLVGILVSEGGGVESRGSEDGRLDEMD